MNKRIGYETITPKKRLNPKLEYKINFPCNFVFEEQNKFLPFLASSLWSERASKKSLTTNPNTFAKKKPKIKDIYSQLNPTRLLQKKPPNNKVEETSA